MGRGLEGFFGHALQDVVGPAEPRPGRSGGRIRGRSPRSPVSEDPMPNWLLASLLGRFSERNV